MRKEYIGQLGLLCVFLQLKEVLELEVFLTCVTPFQSSYSLDSGVKIPYSLNGCLKSISKIGLQNLQILQYGKECWK